ncbi:MULTISPECIES: sugar ABC transporter permease [unclassified Actinomyces]|uniref:carbohydrate ABC transporter permease n=1 Tax=unclassified Actinomyces TaxID=2609248 RepID=UPI00201830BC|nr:MULTISPECIES: sugar ABC transporter permease [unclassified Actinomyces]MCL3778289.1 sugar ABC transporter permease [Actinomyces sp. AC-20-1]MCL3788751.1 sugar ABC transporter permease [Actinomyces sp. 187325]MCL3791619.1 sugar ABC transporter permease [Actinomyces sp. 186855]MCL3794282.1 sugar ABC transporter permease [Actinomyces sp. 217892]
MTAPLSTTPARPTAAQHGRRRRAYKGERTLRNSVVALIITFNAVLLVYPIATALLGSFHQWNPLNGTYRWIGGENYTELLHDPTFWTSLTNTLYFSVVVIVARVVLGLALAYAIWSKVTRHKTFFRAVFYMPTVTPMVAIAYVWKMMYNPQVGVFHTFLGIDINWLYDSTWALPAVMLMTIWKDFGYAVILFLSALHSLPEDALEAAAVDGAGSWQRLRRIILPLLRPMTVFVVITSLISYAQAYVQILIMTQGGPGKSTFLISYIIFDEAFQQYDFGYASAIAFVLLIITAALTAVSFGVSARHSGGRS